MVKKHKEQCTSFLDVHFFRLNENFSLFLRINKSKMDPLVGQKGVKYGLQVRKPEKKDAKKSAPPKRSIFGDDASDEDEDNVERQIARHAARKQNDKKVCFIEEFISLH